MATRALTIEAPVDGQGNVGGELRKFQFAVDNETGKPDLRPGKITPTGLVAWAWHQQQQEPNRER